MTTNTINQQPLYSSLLSTDYFLVWQGSQSPPTRKVPVAGLASKYAYLSTANTFADKITVNSNGIEIIGNSIFHNNTTTAGNAFVTGALTGGIWAYIAGLTLSNDGGSPTTVLDIATGVCTDSTDAAVISLPTFTKSTGGSWVAGTGGNGMGVGLTIAASTVYHVFAILNTGVADVYFDTSPSAAHAPTGTTAFRRIGSIETDGSAHIIPFTQSGDTFLWATEFVSQNTTAPTSTANVSLSVPSGISVTALLKVTITNASGAFLYLAAPGVTINTGSGSLACTTAGGASGEYSIPTNTSSQIQCYASAGSTTLQIVTKGWIDRRGRDA